MGVTNMRLAIGIVISGLCICIAQQQQGGQIEVLAKDERPEAEIVTITPDGLFPAKISRRVGPFHLVIQNRAGIKGDIDLRIESESKVLAKALKTMKEREIDSGELVRLPVGVYTLSIQGRNKHSMTLEIKAQ
jgi:hypothetical protein